MAKSLVTSGMGKEMVWEYDWALPHARSSDGSPMAVMVIYR